MRKSTEKILAAAGERIWQYAELKIGDVEFSEEVVAACRANYCGNYNKSWRCPPNVGTLEELKEKYTKYPEVFVFTTKHEIEDSFDIEGMFAARLEHDKVENLIRPVLPEGSQVLGAGGCNVCEKCAFPEPCRFPEKAKTSVEACGINVVSLAKTAKINYTNGENTVTYFTLVPLNGDETERSGIESDSQFQTA